MYLNHLMTDRELIDTAQYAENPHLRLLAERLDDKLVIIRDARDALTEVYKVELSEEAICLVDQVQDILER
jgi:hypothetical protein